MTEEVKEMTKDDIELYLNGHNPLEHVVCIESDWGSDKVSLIIDDPEKGKRVEVHTFEAFSFIKDLKKAKNPFYRNNKEELSRAVAYNGITSKKLETRGIERIEDGYKYLIKSSKSPRHLDNFFKGGDLKFFSKEFDDESTYDKGFAVTPSNAEQFMIQSGVRLFKGVDKYSEVHKFYFDIETTSLLPQTGHIFMIGMCTNRGFRKVLAIDYNDPESERNMIIEFFNTIHVISPTIILGYNSESFDFTFLLGRAEELGIDFGTMVDGTLHYDVRTSLDPLKPIKRQPKTLKFGSETERYQQTNMWGYNVIDIAHAVRAAKAINSEIKSWSLKYVTQFIKANKPTRTYVDGDKIYKIWKENKYYFHNIKNYKYELIPDKYQSEEGSKEYLEKIKAWISQEKSGQNTNESIKKLSEFLDNDENNVEIIMGNQIIFNYLIDDLEETMAVDENFCTPNFLLSKNLPTTYVRTSTMGTAVKWKLLLTGFAYLNNFAIPANDKKKDIVGGLSRLLYCGYAKDVLKLDYNSLYPSIQLTHDVFPDIDIYGFLKLSLSHFRDKRNYFKGLSKKHQKLFEKNGDNLDRVLAKQYDTVQLPVKILNNGEFGAVSAPHIFNWGGNHDGETVTCYGRQYLRRMIWFFNQRGFKPLVGDTDGFNFSMPENYKDLRYTNLKGESFESFHAVIAEFNDLYMTGVMGLSLDGLYDATINLARKNYIDLNDDGSIKLVGNSLKSSTLCKFFDDVIQKTARLLVENRPKEYIELYYESLEKIYNMEVPLIDIATKSKVKETLEDYIYDQKHKTNKNGDKVSRKAHMELLVKANLQPDMGSYVYFINIGKAKSHNDIEHLELLDERDFISDPNKTGYYNVPQAIDKFNEKMKMFLVCFKDVVRESLIVKNPKDRAFFTDSDIELQTGKPLEMDKQDALDLSEYKEGMTNEPLMEMSEKEVMFWNRSERNPNDVFPYFTTELSREPLLSQEEKVEVRRKGEKIIEFFKNSGVSVKMEYEYARDHEITLRYSKLYKTTIEVTNKRGRVSEEIIHQELNEMSWILSKYDEKRKTRMDFQVIDYSLIED